MLSNGPGIERALKESGLRRNTKENPTNNVNEADAKLNRSKTQNGAGVKRSGSDGTKQELDHEKKLPKWFKPGKPTPRWNKKYFSESD